MEVLRGQGLLRISRVTYSAMVTDAKPSSPTEVVDDSNRAAYTRIFKLARSDCEALGLTFSIIQIDRILWLVNQPDTDYASLNAYAFDLDRRVEDELKDILLFRVPPERATYYQDPWRGWEAIIEKFSSVGLDVEESGKCLALGRYTASVFHAMRILEVGLGVLAGAVGVDSDYANWQKIIDQIEAACKSATQDRARKEDSQFYSEAATQFLYFKEAWRNHVMHVRQNFDEERATRIYDSTRAFMGHLAAKLSKP